MSVEITFFNNDTELKQLKKKSSFMHYSSWFSLNYPEIQYFKLGFSKPF